MPSPVVFAILGLLLPSFSIVLANRNPPGWIYAVDIVGAHQGVHCAGDFPPHTPQMLTPWGNQRYATYNNLAHICLSTIYLGRTLNLGGICSTTATDPYSLSFLPDNMQLSVECNLYCKTKCWCTGGESGFTRSASQYGRGQELPIRHTYFTYNRLSNSITPITQISELINRHFAHIQLLESFPFVPYKILQVHLSGLESERVACSDWPMPQLEPPLNAVAYTSLLEFCAASIYGGSQIGNMGGYCKQDPVFGRIWSQDEDLAHPTLVGKYPFLVFCFALCQCADSPTPNVMRALPFAPGLAVDVRQDVIYIHDLNRPLGHPEVFSFQVQQSDDDGSPTTHGTQSMINLNAVCDGQDSDMCTNAVSKNRKSISLEMRSDPLPILSQVYRPHRSSCRGTCSGQIMCRAGCSCAVDLPEEDLHQLGQDPVFPSAICLAISVITAINSNGVRGIGGRDLASDQQQMACVCNSTYVSFGCCGIPTGMIWESGKNKLGELEI